MKNFLAYLANVVLLGCMFTSCAQEDITTLLVGKDTYLSLEINSGQLASRATVEETESGIQTLDIFLYPNGATDEDAVLHVPYTLNTIDTDGTVTVPVKVSSSNVKSLFPDNAMTCTAYVLANKGDITLPSSTDMASLKGMAIQADFTKDQTSFVMDGSNQVTYDATLKKISGKVELVRAASKISLIVTSVTGQVEDDFGNKWKSDPSQMKVGFYNGVKKTNVDVTYENCQYTVTDGDYFNITNRALSGTNEYTHTKPFYSYSSAWESGSATASYLILVLPWQKLDEQGNPIGDYMPCYYQVPINETNKKLERNHYYEIKLSVGILGSFTPDEPLVVDDASYVVLDWSEALTSAELKEYRYLVVDQNFVEMDNINTVDINMATSHPISYQILSITKPNYSQEDIRTTTIYSYNEGTGETKGSAEKFSFGPNNDNTMLNFAHVLDNVSTSSTYDYVPYTIKAKVWHTDNPNYFEVIDYIQYPAMYIVAEKNEGGNIVSDKETTNDDKGYVFVYNNQIYSGGNWQVVRSCLDGGNNNPNMYVINVSAFVSETDYIIGDPRTESSKSGSSLGIGNTINGKSLTNYYETRTDNEAIIAPKFRMASSYGKCGSAISLSDAKKRCAAYQEQGYPAGRWRVPTVAEFKYIAYLSGKGYIPHLYTDDGEYWAATDKCTYSNSGTIKENYSTSGSAYVRCVYDEWYWTDKCDKTKFTWGDKEITW